MVKHLMISVSCSREKYLALCCRHKHAAPSSFVVCGFTGQVAKSEQLAFGFASFMDVISRGGSKDPETEISLLSNVVL